MVATLPASTPARFIPVRTPPYTFCAPSTPSRTPFDATSPAPLTASKISPLAFAAAFPAVSPAPLTASKISTLAFAAALAAASAATVLACNPSENPSPTLPAPSTAAPPTSAAIPFAARTTELRRIASNAPPPF